MPDDLASLRARVTVLEQSLRKLATINAPAVQRWHEIGLSYNGTVPEFVFNELGRDIDFRFEGDTVTDVMKVDAGADAVFFGGDVFFKTSGAGLAYGDMYTNDAIAVTLTTQNQWYEIDAAQAWTGGVLNLCTFTDPYVTVSKAGNYLVNYMISGQVNAANQGIGLAILVDQTTVQNAGQARTMYLNSARNLTMGSTAIITLTANQKVSLAARNISSGGKIFTAQKGNMTVVMIGG